MSQVRIEESWKSQLSGEFEKPYFQTIAQFLKKEIRSGKVIYPPGPRIFNAFDSTPFEQVKVVILGQDPYHNPGEAMGLCFSVPRGKRIPPSLQNIYKEIQNDLGAEMPVHGDLSYWARQGVFLLNAMLTVEQNRPSSHRDIGWQDFTDAVIRRLSDGRDGLVFMLWGNFARKKKTLIDGEKHCILEAPHPSPFSANSGFFGCKHFSRANAYLERNGQDPINWQVD